MHLPSNLKPTRIGTPIHFDDLKIESKAFWESLPCKCFFTALLSAGCLLGGIFLRRMVISLKVTVVGPLCFDCIRKAHLGSDKTNLYAKEILPLLQEYCYDCHGDGAKKGKLALDIHSNPEEITGDHQLWKKVWENLHRRNMPPADMEQPGDKEIDRILSWMKNRLRSRSAKDRTGARGLEEVEPGGIQKYHS